MGAGTGFNQTAAMSGGFSGGSGTLNYLAKWTPNGTTLGNSLIRDNGVSVWFNGAGLISTNTSFGEGALDANTTGAECTAFGEHSLSANTTGNGNTAFGSNAGELNTTGAYGTFIGSNAGLNNSTGDYNTFIGRSAGSSNTTGYSNTFIGITAGSSMVGGNTCTAIGAFCLSNATGNKNTAIGDHAANSLTSGTENTIVGTSAAETVLTTGTKNTILGASTAVTNAGDSGNVILGYGATATGSNQFVVGSAGTNAGTVTAEAVTSDATWSVIINGTAYKILLKA